MWEMEAAMLRSYRRAADKVSPQTQGNFLLSANIKDAFVKEFMKNMQERRPTIETEIQKGGYRNNYTTLTDNVYKKIEERIRAELTSALVQQQDTVTIQKFIRNIGQELRSVFYDNYSLR